MCIAALCFKRGSLWWTAMRVFIFACPPVAAHSFTAPSHSLTLLSRWPVWSPKQRHKTSQEQKTPKPWWDRSASLRRIKYTGRTKLDAWPFPSVVPSTSLHFVFDVQCHKEFNFFFFFPLEPGGKTRQSACLRTNKQAVWRKGAVVRLVSKQACWSRKRRSLSTHTLQHFLCNRDCCGFRIWAHRM